MSLLNESEKPGKIHFQILAMCWAGWVFDFYDLILFSFLLIPIGNDLHLSNVGLSYIMGASLAATAVGGVIFGILSDRYGRKNVLQWTIITYSIGTFLCGLASSLEVLLVFRIITGLGIGGEWATGQTYVGESFPSESPRQIWSGNADRGSFGIVLASIVGGFLAPEIGWRGSFFISILPALLVIFIRKKLPESDVWIERKRLSLDNLQSQTLTVQKEPSKFLLLFSLAI